MNPTLPSLTVAATVRPQGERDALRDIVLPSVLLGLACIAMFLSSPTDGDFWWFDAPGHAMNGAFIRDLIVAMPANPVRWAIDYYLRLPAVTILFYPPLFPIVEGFAFLIFGISHAVAQATVLVFVWLFALGVFALCRERLSVPAALGAALLALGMPAVAFWGRQVMLELPASAFAVWSAVFLLRYLRSGSPRLLYYAVTVFCLILYTKQTFAFLGIVFILLLLIEQGTRFLARRATWIAAAIGVVLLTPFAAMTYAFGRFNATLATAQPLEANTTEGILYYAATLPKTAGWLVLLLTLAAALRALRGDWRRPDTLTILLLLWLAIGYGFFSFLALKDERYALHFLVPFAVFAAMFMYRLAAGCMSGWFVLAVGAASLAFTLITQPVPYVGGLRTAAERAVRMTPAGGTIMFIGHRSAAFIFNVRALGDRRDLAVLRPEKLLLTFQQGRRFGVAEKELPETAVADMIFRYRVTTAVVQPHFWDDLPPMQRLFTVLGSDQFHQVASIPASGNVEHEEASFDILENRAQVAPVRSPMSVDMPLIGREFSQ
jgi:hypothetical protein